MHNESELLSTLIFPLMMKRTIVIGESQGLHQASLSPTMKNTIINAGSRAHLVKAWEMTL